MPKQYLGYHVVMASKARRADSDTSVVHHPVQGHAVVSANLGGKGGQTVIRSASGRFVSKTTDSSRSTARARSGGDELVALKKVYAFESGTEERPLAAEPRKVPVRAARRSKAADDPLAPARTRWLAEVVGGGARLAELLGVSASQTSRWAAGQERPGIQVAPLLIDLEHVLARARLVWAEPAASTWMVSVNAHLGGARPVDVLRLNGPGPVLDALDAGVWGGAA
jgi:hypothetical protein